MRPDISVSGQSMKVPVSCTPTRLDDGPLLGDELGVEGSLISGCEPAMLIVVGDTWSISKPASRSRFTARAITSSSEQNWPQFRR